ncbi:MAG TPA: 2-oxoglutarate dehydrogenase, E2 component, dihydrolipoamide succinyltransferase, partial [Micromonosporaceae bacterium]|nr:2-oxoglutarate dehydrogenase, E2 component, dihydrolipoamide succinyltransferase [Micromonosporaceae bacterium]
PQAEAPQAAAAGGEGTPVKMPALGESVTEGTVTRWLKSVGDTVEADEPLLEVSTDKVDTEIPSPVAGTLLEISVPEDETVAVGAQLALIGVAGAAPAQAAPAPAAPAPAAPPKAEPAPAEPAEALIEQAPPPPPPAPTPTGAPTQAAEPSGEGADGYVTPLVRKLANQHGVDLAAVAGTGVGGRIRKQDVLDAAEKAKAPAPAAAPAAAKPAEKAASAPSPLRGRTEKLPRLRMTIAKRMVESLQVSAQLTTVVEVDVTRIARLREQAKADFLATHGVKLSYLPFFALASVEALRSHPNLNASMDMEAGTVTYHDAEHLGMAVDTEKGLIVPVIRNAGDLNLAGLAKRIADVAERTRTNKITPDELSGGTFTLTNTGSRGALFDTPIINQPQSAILGTGAVVRRAVVVDDPDLGELILPRSMVYLALSYDHRLVDGADAARFLTAIKERLEAGNFEAELGL